MLARHEPKPAAPHIVTCPDCDGTGHIVGYRCCGGQGCGCERTCGVCDGVGSCEGYLFNDRVVDAIRAEEIHEDSEPDIACNVDDCPWCAAQTNNAASCRTENTMSEGTTVLGFDEITTLLGKEYDAMADALAALAEHRHAIGQLIAIAKDVVVPAEQEAFKRNVIATAQERHDEIDLLITVPQ